MPAFRPEEFAPPVQARVEGLDREGRVQLLGQAFEALLAGRMPSPEACAFLGGAGSAWLENGGDLERDFFRVTKAKSKRTPSVIWQEFRDHRDDPDHPDDENHQDDGSRA